MTDEQKLYATTNASIWAEEWCKVARELQAEGKDLIDEGWMIGWFANAMETAKTHALARTPDKLINKLLDVQQEANPDTDPGGITIDVQDDSPMVAVMQNRAIIGFGSSIQDALEKCVANWGI